MHIFKNALLQTVYPNRPLLTPKKKKKKNKTKRPSKYKTKNWPRKKKHIYIYENLVSEGINMTNL